MHKVEKVYKYKKQYKQEVLSKIPHVFMLLVNG